MRRHRLIALVALMGMTIAACGLKPDVQVAAGGGGTAGGGDASVDGFGDTGDGFGATDEGFGTGDPVDTSTDTPAPTGGGATGGTTGGSTGGSTGGGATATTAPPASGGGGATATTAPPAGGGGGPAAPLGSRPGIDVDKKEIRIGVHAPVSGAAPVPQETFQEAIEDYWKWLTASSGGVFGEYSVKVFFQDDEFNPTVARQRCLQMVEQNDVFLLVGGGGADQITACAQYANSVGVPYLSAGVNEDGLSSLKGYFALSQTYAQQAAKLAELAKGLGTKVGLAVSNSKSFADGYNATKAAMQAAGLQIVYDNANASKNVEAGEGLQIASDMKAAGVEVAYMLMSPTSFIAVAQGGGGQAFIPKYIGPGITSGLNTVAKVGCPGIGEARFFSPFMGLDTVDQFDPNFKKNSIANDDLALALWGLNESVHELFKAAGPNMTRGSFVGALEAKGSFKFKVFNPLNITPQNHLGGQSMHLLRADCAAGVYVTQGTFGSL